jgi:polyhydroxybutyrate depolymerase
MRKLHLVLGATASLTALLLGCSADPESEGPGGPVTQGGSGGATGGRSSSGGVSTGGAATGGATTGGKSAQATGGASTGGASTGGASSKGGATSGGAATGGKASGGASGGSAAAGGSPNGGSGGTSNNAGAGGGSTTAKRSAGCDKTTTQALNSWVESMVMTSGANRPYSVRLPTGYDPARAYPVVVLLHGCGSGTNNVPIEKASGSDAILVRGTGSAANTCWEAAANGKDVAFFDSMVADTKARFCADESRVFIVGYSSGSWLANQLTCIRGDVVRGAATVAGGESSNGKCGVPVARIFLHDTEDMDNKIADDERARTRQLTQNMCDASAAPTDVEPSPCKAYSGCKAGYPVHWCQTTGKGHSAQSDLAPSAFWNFFKAL